MPPSKYRPSKLNGKTQTYNVVFLVETLDAVKRFADGVQISPAAFVRGAVAEALIVSVTPAEVGLNPSPEIIKLAESKEAPMGGYRNGVEDACARLAKNTRLNVKMASGNTMGADIAQHILRDLLP